MESGQQENIANQNQWGAVSKERDNKKLYGVVLFLVTLILILAGFNWWLKDRSSKRINIGNQLTEGQRLEESQPFVEESYRKVTEEKRIPDNKGVFNQEVALKLSEWLEKQRDDRGVYYHQVKCEVGGSCQTMVSNHSGLSVIWGRFRYYQQTKKVADLEIVKKDLDLYTNRSVVETVQNDSWNCRLMYDIRQNSNLDDNYKKKLESICFESAYLKPEQLTGSDGIVKSSIFAADFVAKYNWRENSGDLKLARDYYERALALFDEKGQKEPTNVSWGEKCAVGIASLDLFKQDKDPKKLTKAMSMLEKKEEINNSIDLFGKTVCILLMQDLSLVSENGGYKNTIDEVLNGVIKNNFDYRGYKSVIGTGGFMSGSMTGKATKLLRENGLILGVLSR